VADYSQADFDNLRASRLTDAATALQQARPAWQADYDLDDERLRELADTLFTFKGLKVQPRQAVIEGKPARASLRVEFAELGTLLQDRLMRQLHKYERCSPTSYARTVAAQARRPPKRGQQRSAQNPSGRVARRKCVGKS